MIVDPDFLGHWKTTMLTDSLADERAPLYVLHLWAHCQNRRQSKFDNVTPAALKAICKYKGDADFEKAMSDAGFIRRSENGGLEVCNWDEYNSKLIAAWDNGGKGGRPKKNPNETQEKPTGNPRETHRKPNNAVGLAPGKPTDNPGVSDRIREEKSREDKINSPQSPPKAERVVFEEIQIPQNLDFELGKRAVETYKAIQRSNDRYNPIAFQDMLYQLGNYSAQKAIGYLRGWTRRNRYAPDYKLDWEEYAPKESECPAPKSTTVLCKLPKRADGTYYDPSKGETRDRT